MEPREIKSSAGTSGAQADERAAWTLATLIRAARSGDSEAQFALADRYERGSDVPQDYSEAAKWYKFSAEAGKDVAQFALGRLYAEGLGLHRDECEALKWFLKAAGQGHREARFRMDLIEATRGRPAAQFRVGQHFETAFHVSKDFREAVEWYRRAAQQEYTSAYRALGRLYESHECIGIKRDTAAAMVWYRLAARNGDGTSQFCLGRLYECTDTGPEATSEAAKWYRVAAETGNRDAQLRLAEMHRQGLGVPVDFAEADRLLRLAAAQDPENRADIDDSWYGSPGWGGHKEPYGGTQPQLDLAEARPQSPELTPYPGFLILMLVVVFGAAWLYLISLLA